LGGRRLGSWPVETGGQAVELDQVLKGHGQPVIADRFPVLSVGSNTSPAQLDRKFRLRGVWPMVPLVKVQVYGIIPGVSAHVSKPGYVPATCVVAPGAVTGLFMAWLGAVELEASTRQSPTITVCGWRATGIPLCWRGVSGCLGAGHMSASGAA
jgi:hypothetical protein